MLDTIINEVAQRFDLGAKARPLILGLLSLIRSDPGGLTGFVDRFRKAGLTDLVSPSLQGVATAVAPAQLESALGRDSLGRLASGAGISVSTAASVLGFALPKLFSAIAPGGSLPTRLPDDWVRLLPAYSAEKTGVYPREERVAPSRPAWLWPLLALLLLGALGWWLLGRSTREPVAPARTSVAAPSINASLTLRNTGGRVRASGVVRSETEKNGILDTLRAAFGAGNVEDAITIDARAGSPGWIASLRDLVAGFAKVPGAEVRFDGNDVRVAGAISDAARSSLLEQIRGLLGAGYRIDSLAFSADAFLRSATDQASQAISALKAGFTGTDLVRALNVQVVNFATGSAEIPADATGLLDRSAEAMKGAPAATRIEIGGHTDNVGDEAANLKLSEARAESVRAYLVGRGVTASTLTARGYGSTRPVAGNDSEEGRFRNRRIEYTVMQ